MLPTLRFSQGWLKMVSFLAQGFKTGSFANPAADQLVLWARPHPAAAVASADALGPPSNAQQVRSTFSLANTILTPL
jgi:glucan endo-1,3-alpha-glucosidase